MDVVKSDDSSFLTKKANLSAGAMVQVGNGLLG